MKINQWTCADCIHKDVCKYASDVKIIFDAKKCSENDVVINIAVDIECEAYKDIEED